VTSRPLAATDSQETLLVAFRGRRLLDAAGSTIAELAADGRWYTTAGELCHGLRLSNHASRDAATTAADGAWLREAGEIITRLAEENAYLTSDDVWALVETAPSESKMMGNALTRARELKIITRTNEYRRSVRRQNHGRQILVWQSLRYDQQHL
jgi:hypothetical protein